MGLVAPRHVGSSRTRARTRVPCIGRQILNHCTTREVRKPSSFPHGFYLNFLSLGFITFNIGLMIQYYIYSLQTCYDFFHFKFLILSSQPPSVTLSFLDDSL